MCWHFLLLFILHLLLLNYADAFDGIEFEPFRPADSYKCGQFMEATINDPAMRLFYKFNNAFIRLLSKPFPHEKLLTRDALQGNLDDVRVSLETNYMQWFDFEQNWAIVCASIVLMTAVFTVLYLFHRCCMCCCRRGRKPKITDSRFDNCKRVMLDVIISVFILINLFAAVVLVISTQYTQYGLEELPTRLHYCVNDLSVYKFENNERIRKLLRDDFHLLNTTLFSDFESIGTEIVKKLKRSTGANLIDELTQKTRDAGKLKKSFEELEQDLRQVQIAKGVLAKQLYKLRESEPMLRRCAEVKPVVSATPTQSTTDASPTISHASLVDPARVRICRAALQLIQPLINNDAEIVNADSTESILSPRIPETLQEIIALDMEDRFYNVSHSLNLMQSEIQKVVNSRREDVIDRLKSLDDTMFRLYDDISNGIKGVDLKVLDDLVDPMMQHRERYKAYIQNGWIVALIIGGLFLLIACLFLLGLFYGCCGRRPSYYNDDCCVRTTGSKFYTCAIWLSMMFLVFFACLTAALIFIGANASNLFCHPLEDPLSRPDMLSLLDRVIDTYGLQDPQTLSRYNVPQLFTATRQPADLIRGCERGATFYTMFGLDKKFKLLRDGGPQDEYEDLRATIKDFGVGQRFVPDNMNFYDRDTADAIRRLGDMQLAKIEEQTIKEFRASAPHYEVDAVLHQLKKVVAEKGLLPPISSADLASQPSSGQPSSAALLMSEGLDEVETIVKYLDELKPSALSVLTQIESTSTRMEKLKVELDRLTFNNTDLHAKLQHTNAMLNSAAFSERLDEAAAQVTDEISLVIQQYVNHINQTMSHEVSSCEPIRKIVFYSRAAVCDYALDPFNGLWMAMAISILFLIPIVIISTRLRTLYARIFPYHHYLQDAAEMPNDTNFATDVYGVDYGSTAGAGNEFASAMAVTHGGGARMMKPIGYGQATSNFNSHFLGGGQENNGAVIGNYGYQELYPPPYRSTRS